jgi:hypothetical protein
VKAFSLAQVALIPSSRSTPGHHRILVIAEHNWIFFICLVKRRVPAQRG